MKTTNSLTRRSVLAAGWKAAAVAGLGGVRLLASGGNPAGGRTLVCLYLLGGHDGNNMIVPLDRAQYSAYAAARSALALSRDSLLPVIARSHGTNFGLHPALIGLQQRFVEGSLAIVANVGPDVRPGVPPRGGIQRDPCYSGLRFQSDGYATLEWAAQTAGVTGWKDDRVVRSNRGVTMLALDGSAPANSGDRGAAVVDAAPSLSDSFPDTPAGRKLCTIAGLMQTRSAGNRVFLAPVGGFGTPAAEMDWMPKLYAEIDAAVSAFYEWTRGNGLDRNVTLFTDSEFGRTLYANAKAGSEPGWGNHQFVIGGAVLGGEIYGQFPDMVSDPLTPDGAWIPTTTRGQYHATLASWIGLTPRELDALSASAGVPNLALLGFMAG